MPAAQEPDRILSTAVDGDAPHGLLLGRPDSHVDVPGERVVVDGGVAQIAKVDEPPVLLAPQRHVDGLPKLGAVHADLGGHDAQPALRVLPLVAMRFHRRAGRHAAVLGMLLFEQLCCPDHRPDRGVEGADQGGQRTVQRHLHTHVPVEA